MSDSTSCLFSIHLPLAILAPELGAHLEGDIQSHELERSVNHPQATLALQSKAGSVDGSSKIIDAGEP